MMLQTDVIDAEFTVLDDKFTTERCSSLPIALRCPASRCKPEIVEGAGEPANLGTAVHEANAAAVLGKPVDLAVIAARWRVDLKDLSFLHHESMRMWESHLSQYLQATESGVEQALETHWATVTETPGRRTTYRVKLTGHADLLHVNDTEAWLVDWKTGHGDGDHREQMRGYGVLAMERHPLVERVHVAIAKPRDGMVEWQTFTAEELRAWMDQACKDLHRDPSIHIPGEHCRYCVRSLTCEAKTSLIRNTIHAMVDHSYGDGVAELPTDLEARGERLGALLANMKVVETVMDKVRDWIRNEIIAGGGTMPISPEREIHMQEEVSRKIDTKAAWPIIEQTLGDNALDTVEIGLTRLKDAVSASAPRGQKKKAIESVMQQLRDRGAITETVRHKMVTRPRTLLLEENHDATADAGTDDVQLGGARPESQEP